MESIIRDALVTHMENTNQITAHQHGFMSGRSCLTNLLETLESWTRILDAGYGIDVIYLDYKKAFDTVPHRRLISNSKDVVLVEICCNGFKLFWWADQ